MTTKMKTGMTTKMKTGMTTTKMKTGTRDDVFVFVNHEASAVVI
jgi:hypothetical protein